MTPDSLPVPSSSSQMATIRYFAGPGAEVSFTTLAGESRVAAFDASGFYTTSDDEEISALDALADSPGSPVAHADEKQTAPKASKPKASTTTTSDTTDTMSEDIDAADR